MLSLHSDVFTPLCREGEIIFEKKKEIQCSRNKDREHWNRLSGDMVRGCEVVLPKRD